MTTTVGHDGDDQLTGEGWLIGGAGNDDLTGGSEADILEGGSGSDMLKGGGGSDLLDGGDGWDVASYQSATSGVVVDMTTNANGGAAAGDQVSNIEVLQGSNSDDTLIGIDNGGGNGVQLYGEGGHDTLLGKAGGDYLFGGAGNDLLDSGFGDDALNGGAGADTFRFSTALGPAMSTRCRTSQGPRAIGSCSAAPCSWMWARERSRAPISTWARLRASIITFCTIKAPANCSTTSMARAASRRSSSPP
jgi:Ca2+-binding RTX toxin-like protein